MTDYINPLAPTKGPVNTTYTNLIVPGGTAFLWPWQNKGQGQNYIASETIIRTSPGANTTLPDVNLVSPGATFTLQDTGSGSALLAADGSFIVTLSNKVFNFTVTKNVTSEAQSTAWRFYEIGVTSTTNTFAQDLGNSMRVTDQNKIQVAQTVSVIQSVLTLSGGAYQLNTQAAKDFSGTILLNPSTITTQTNIVLGSSNTLYAACGYFGTFVNNSPNPVVLQTQGDTINGIDIQSVNNTSSFIVAPGASVTISSTPNQNWVIMSQSNQFQNIFRTTTINYSTASYVYLKAAAQIDYVQTEITTDVDDAAAVAIDMSRNVDMFFSPLWILSGNVPAEIEELMDDLGQDTIWIILPNNLSYIYFIQARLTDATWRVGLAAKFGTSISVALPPRTNAYPAGSGATWAFQYSAQINLDFINLQQQFISGLLIANSGGGGGSSFPDITDVDGLVTITGQGGLYIPIGPTRMVSAFIGDKPVATKTPNAVAGNIVISANSAGDTGDSGKSFFTGDLWPTPSQNKVPTQQSVFSWVTQYAELVGDGQGGAADILINDPTYGRPGLSGKQFTIDPTLGGDDPSNDLIPTEKAVKDYIDGKVHDVFNYLGPWDANTNTPTVSDSVGNAGDVYYISVTGAQDLGHGLITYDAGNLLIYNPVSLQWDELPFSSFVVSWNGQVGVVTAGIGDLDDVDVTSPLNNEILVYNSTTSKWENQLVNAVFSWNGLTGTVVAGLGDLDNVVLTAPTTNQFLTYDGTNWINSTPTLPGLTLNGASVQVTLPLDVDATASFSASAFFPAQVTFGVASPASQNPPLYIGGYATTPNVNSLATIAYVNEAVSQAIQFPNIVDNIVTNTVTITQVDGGGPGNLIVTGTTTAQGTLDVTGAATFNSTGSFAQRLTATLGVVYPNIPNCPTAFSVGLGWDGTRVRYLIDNNPAATAPLANLSDVSGIGALSGGYHEVLTVGNFTVPAGVYGLSLEVSGNGGGGGGGGISGNNNGGGGGASGVVTIYTNIDVIPGDIFVVSSGGTGGGGAPGSDGSAGGNMSFTLQRTGFAYSSSGGAGGQSGNGGGQGGLATVGLLQCSGSIANLGGNQIGGDGGSLSMQVKGVARLGAGTAGSFGGGGGGGQAGQAGGSGGQGYGLFKYVQIGS